MYDRESEHEGSSNRNFGLIVGGILALIGLVRVGLHWGEGMSWLTGVFIGVGAVLVVLGLAAPNTLTLPNRLWMKLGLLLSKIVNPIVLGLIYLVAIVPFGLMIRLTGGDLLKHRFDPEAKSYWVVRDPPGPAPDTMTNQF
jgi:hypothetical protein